MPNEPEREVNQPHAHRWLIAEPSGASSVGTCKVCGVTKGFQNSTSRSDFVTGQRRDRVPGTVQPPV